MQINKNAIFPTATLNQQSQNNDWGIDKEVFDKLRQLVIKDKIDISEDGKKLLDSSTDLDLFDPANIKVWENEFDIDGVSSETAIEDLFIDSAIEYKNERMRLEGANDAVRVQELDAAYMNNLKQEVDRIANHLDRYFDRGTLLNDVYGEEPQKDLFDVDLFKGHLTTSVLAVKDEVMKMDGPDSEGIHKDLLSNQRTTSLEQLSFNDLKELYRFTTEPLKFGDSIDQYDIGSAKKIAVKEKELNKSIRKLSLSDTVKNAMYTVNKRVSQGMLKHVAYKNEEKMYANDMEQYDRMLKNLMNMLQRFGVIIDDIKEDFGISPKNKRLLKYIGRQQDVAEQYDALKAEKDREKQAFAELESNKHNIMETDSYKRVKAEYDQEMKKK